MPCHWPFVVPSGPFSQFLLACCHKCLIGYTQIIFQPVLLLYFLQVFLFSFSFTWSVATWIQNNIVVSTSSMLLNDRISFSYLGNGCEGYAWGMRLCLVDRICVFFIDKKTRRCRKGYLWNGGFVIGRFFTYLWTFPVGWVVFFFLVARNRSGCGKSMVDDFSHETAQIRYILGGWKFLQVLPGWRRIGRKLVKQGLWGWRRWRWRLERKRNTDATGPLSWGVVVGMGTWVDPGGKGGFWRFMSGSEGFFGWQLDGVGSPGGFDGDGCSGIGLENRKIHWNWKGCFMGWLGGVLNRWIMLI